MNPLEFIKEIKELIFDSNTSWGKLITKLISLLVLLLIIDFSFNFTYNLHTSNKLSQLETISSLKKSYESDSIKITEIEKIESIIFNKEHYSEFLPRIFSEISFNIKTKDQNIPQINTETTITTNPIRNLFWMTFSSNYLLLIIIPFVILLPLYDKSSRSGNGIAGWVTALVMLGGITSLITWISYQIPLIYNRPYLNYILNFLIHTFFLILSVAVSGDKKKN
ncbi:hypothetical protein [Nonlabens ulvanivorans]|uniref:hypothetical protein n=1 Tax=Nonlabens ulvanivorans TaxID=906888 RepID=UPI002942BD97|nr:hypothetical protein [Nonlabens ulvanivorans]WOI23599.1 hypothetical protein R1T42_03900 [Nonlabens ulvanivorans]